MRPGDLPELAIAGTGAFTFLLVAALIRPGGMGMGDVKLAGVMGLYLGLSVIPALLVAFLSGSVVGIAMMARGGIGERKSAVPFAPFLALGGIVALLAGPGADRPLRGPFPQLSAGFAPSAKASPASADRTGEASHVPS